MRIHWSKEWNFFSVFLVKDMFWLSIGAFFSFPPLALEPLSIDSCMVSRLKMRFFSLCDKRFPTFQRSARSSHRPRNDRGMSKNSSPRSRLDLGLSLILVSSLVSVSKKVKNPRNSSFFPQNDRGMRKKSSPRSRLDLGLGQANSLELDLGLEKGALADLWIGYCNF